MYPPEDLELFKQYYPGCYGQIMFDTPITNNPNTNEAILIETAEGDSPSKTVNVYFENNKKYVIQICSGGGTQLTGYLFTPGTFEQIPIKLLWENILLLDMQWPQLGVINLKTSCIYTSRVARKQFKQSFLPECVHLLDLCFLEEALSKKPVVSSKHLIYGDVLNYIFNPSYFSVDRAITSLLTSSRRGCAITNQIWLKSSQTLFKDNFYLGFEDTIVGLVPKHSKHSPTCRFIVGNEFLTQIMQPYFLISEDSISV